MNKSLPLNYDFEFVVEEVTNVNDRGNIILPVNPLSPIGVPLDFLDPRLE